MSSEKGVVVLLDILPLPQFAWVFAHSTDIRYLYRFSTRKKTNLLYKYITFLRFGECRVVMTFSLIVWLFVPYYSENDALYPVGDTLCDHWNCYHFVNVIKLTMPEIPLYSVYVMFSGHQLMLSQKMLKVGKYISSVIAYKARFLKYGLCYY
jgi:hypothetical protein